MKAYIVGVDMFMQCLCYFGTCFVRPLHTIKNRRINFFCLCMCICRRNIGTLPLQCTGVCKMSLIKCCTELYQETATSSRNGHIIKKWPHHQEMATSSRNVHFIKKRCFLMKWTFFDEFHFAGTFST